jgi:5-methylcytosine-specific restriction endonuclease McrA
MPVENKRIRSCDATPEDESLICLLYNSGLSSIKVAAQVGFSKPTVLKALRRNGVEIRKHGNPDATSKVCVDCSVEKEIGEFYVRQPRCKKCLIARNAEYKRNNRELVRKWGRDYSKRHRAENRIKDRIWAADNPEKVRLGKMRASHNHLNHKGICTLQEWLDILEKYDHKCLRCGSESKITLDHIIPASRVGSSNTADNLQPLCHSCNSGKQAKVIDYRPDKSCLVNRDKQ